MRKIVVFNLISIDGFFADVKGGIDWHQVDDEFNKFAVEHTSQFGGLIFGKTTYKLFEQFWPIVVKTGKLLDGSKPSKEDIKIAYIIDEVWKIVFSKSLKKVTWKNSKLYHSIDPKEWKKWKGMPGKDLAIFGSGTIVTQFANEGLIDEYRLMVNPIILGKGKSFFAGIRKKLNLKLLKTRTFKNGNVLLAYVPQY